jgi:hypothetical protein
MCVLSPHPPYSWLQCTHHAGQLTPPAPTLHTLLVFVQGQEQVSAHMIDQILQNLLLIGKAFAERGDWNTAAKKLRFVAKLIQQQVRPAHSVDGYYVARGGVVRRSVACVLTSEMGPQLTLFVALRLAVRREFMWPTRFSSSTTHPQRHTQCWTPRSTP